MRNDNLGVSPYSIQAEDLKPCPFCGYVFKDEDMDDVLYPVGRTGLWQVVCLEIAGGCSASALGNTINETVKAWNRRV